MTVAGTEATEVALLDSVTGTPPDPAAPPMVTVPTEVFPPGTLVGFSATETSDNGPIERVAVCDVDPSVAVMVAVTEEFTAEVVTVNVADVAPAATDTPVGIVALDELEESPIERPPDGAGPLILTVPVEVKPPVTEFGVNVRSDKAGGVIVRVAVIWTEPWVALIVTAVELDTPVVAIVKVADVAPAATVTLPGTVAEVELDDRVIEEPPVGAAELKVTVPVEDVPPTTDAGETETA